jgi:enamine deaminase RidA (YjgF/YER057c/UK114 family)
LNSHSSVPPQGHYLPARRHGDLIYVSGMTPRRNGMLLHMGQIALDAPPETCREAIEVATENAIQAASTQLELNERIASVLSLTVYVNSPTGYTRHSQIADLASRHVEESVPGGELPVRAAIGVASLPGDASVEITLIAVVKASTTDG